MVKFQLNIGDVKTGKTLKLEIEGMQAEQFLGKKIGDKVSGDSLGFAGYEFQITGGTDIAGFPMRPGLLVAGRKKILTSYGVGMREKPRKGFRRRKTVHGAIIDTEIVQINMKVVKYGKEPLIKEKSEESTGEKQEQGQEAQAAQ